ncbi:probable disease resistance At4g27220 [Olea europaea subsp. europaea]|nr:probable disease resistance At4g27220 [Olea europaea subsp. europaea]
MGDMLANILVSVTSDYYNLEKKMQNLKRKVELLSCQEADMVARLREEERHPGKRRKSVVKYWLSEVASKQKEFESLEAQVNQNSRISRVTLAKYADEMIEEVTGLLDQGIFSEGVVLDFSETIEEKFVTVEWRGQAFKENLETNDIGKALNLDLSDEDDEHKRATKLGWALERKKRFVLMLDDVWTPFLL